MLEDLLEITPKRSRLPEYDPKWNTKWYGIQALWYEGADYQGKKTKVFAYIGYPEMQKGETVPAVVLVHGGGGHAFAEWIRLWNAKGFAAIAMDVTGYFPSKKWRGLVGTEGSQSTPEDPEYVHQLYDELEEEGYTVGPDNIPETKDGSLPLKEQWFYHGIADTILAHNILRADTRIDSNKIGIMGISWGGVITSLAIGYDNRYAFAIPVYGSAHLDCLPAPELPGLFRDPLIKKHWNASDRLSQVDFPVLWLGQVGDTNFSLRANALSYQDTKRTGSFLTMKTEWAHSHIHAWTAPECYRFAKKVLEKKLPLIKTESAPEKKGMVSFGVQIPEDFENVTARIWYTTSELVYNEQNQLTNSWSLAEAAIADDHCFGVIPENATCYFVEFKGDADGENYISTLFWESNERGEKMERKWNGYRIEEFEFEGQPAKIVFPEKSNGYLAVKTEYWDAFPEAIELPLLEQGFHLCFIQNKNRFGIKEDIDRKARFVQSVQETYALNPGCVLIGMSCGGIFAVKFAATYPELTSCMYLDAPVVNYMSWPCGFGTATEVPEDHTEIFHALGFENIAELLAYRDMPLDYLSELVKCRIPLVLVTGDSDRTVPYPENGRFLEKAYQEAGIALEVYVKPGGDHHPHGLQDPSKVVEFVLRNCR